MLCIISYYKVYANSYDLIYKKLSIDVSNMKEKKISEKKNFFFLFSFLAGSISFTLFAGQEGNEMRRE